MFSFFSCKSGSGPAGGSTPWRGQTYGTMANRDEELGLADDRTKVGSIKESKEKDTESGESAAGPAEATIKVAGKMVSSKCFHPDFINTGDYIVACKPKEKSAGKESVTYFSVHYRTLRAALTCDVLPPQTKENYTPYCFPETPSNLAVLLPLIHSLHPAFADALPWTMNECADLYRMLKAYHVKKHIVESFQNRAATLTPRYPESLGPAPTYEQVFSLLRVVFLLAPLKSKSDVPFSGTPAEELLHGALRQAQLAGPKVGAKSRTASGGWNVFYNPYDVPPELYADPVGAKIWDMCFAIVSFCKEHKACLTDIRVRVPSGSDSSLFSSRDSDVPSCISISTRHTWGGKHIYVCIDL